MQNSSYKKHLCSTQFLAGRKTKDKGRCGCSYFVAVVAVSVKLFFHQLVHDRLVLGFLGLELGGQPAVVLFVTVLRQLLQHL
jgi:hypothetical protein